MRTYLNGLTFIFFVLSVFIIYKTITLPNQPVTNVPPPQKTNYTLPTPKTPPINPSRPKKLPSKNIVKNNPTDSFTPPVSNTVRDETSTDKKEPNHIQETQENSLTLAILGNSAFQANNVSLQANMIDTLKELTQAIKAFGNYQLIIEGHAEQQVENSNSTKVHREQMKSSAKRTQAVTNIMIQNGIPYHKISTLSIIDSSPPGPQYQDNNQHENYRVIIKLIPVE